MSFNKIIIYGHLGRDPEMRFTPQGVPVCTFSVATSERKKGQGDSEPTETTTWFRITAWRNLAETANKYLKRQPGLYRRPAQRPRVDGQRGNQTDLARSHGHRAAPDGQPEQRRRIRRRRTRS